MANEIVTPRLRLRRLTLAAATRLLQGEQESGLAWADGFPTDDTFDAVGAFVRSAEAGAEIGPFGVYQIIRTEDQTVIGDIGFYGPPDGDGAVTVGYGLAPGARRQGFATEALQALVAWALAQPGVRLVKADTLHANVASQRVMERAGMRLYGEDEQLRFYRVP